MRQKPETKRVEIAARVGSAKVDFESHERPQTRYFRFNLTIKYTAECGCLQRILFVMSCRARMPACGFAGFAPSSFAHTTRRETPSRYGAGWGIRTLQNSVVALSCRIRIMLPKKTGAGALEAPAPADFQALLRHQDADAVVLRCPARAIGINETGNSASAGSPVEHVGATSTNALEGVRVAPIGRSRGELQDVGAG